MCGGDEGEVSSPSLPPPFFFFNAHGDPGGPPRPGYNGYISTEEMRSRPRSLPLFPLQEGQGETVRVARWKRNVDEK